MNSTVLFANPLPAIKVISLTALVKVVKNNTITRHLKNMVKNNFVYTLLSAPVA